MKLNEAISEIRRHRQHAAIFDELLAYLGKAKDGTLELLMDGDEQVESDYVEQVLDLLEALKAEHEEKVAELESLEVLDDSGAG